MCLRAAIRLTQPVATSTCCFGQAAGVPTFEGPWAALAPAATVLSYYFPGAKLIRTDSSSPSVIVALGEKFTKVTPRLDVLKQLSHDGITLTTESVAPLPQPTPSC